MSSKAAGNVAKLRPFYNVRDPAFGALGNASGDDSVAIQAAIDAANAAGGGWVYIPKGIYRITNSISLPAYSNVRITGDGANATQILVAANNVKCFSVTGLATRITIEEMWLGSSSARTGCYGVEVAGTSAAAPASEIFLNKLSIQNLNNPIHWTHVHQSKIETVRALQSVDSGITGNGLYFFDVITARVRDLTVLVTTGLMGAEYVKIDGDCDTVVLDTVDCYGGNTNVGIRLQQGAGSTGPRLTRLTNCYVELAGNTGFLVSAGRDVRLEGCHAAVNGSSGFQISGGDSIVIANSLALQNQQYGFLVTGGTGTALLGNTASNNSQAADNTVDGIRIENNVTHCRVIGNRSGEFIFTLTNDQRYGLSIGATNTDYIVAVGNDLQGNDTGTLGNFSTGANNYVDLNTGWVNRARGTDSIASGTTSKAVTHGLSGTPAAANISVIFTEQGTNDYGRWWISGIGATQFTVNVSADPGASNLDFSWQALMP